MGEQPAIHGITNPALLLLAIVNRHSEAGGSYHADRESFMVCGEKCSAHPDLEDGFEPSEDLMSDIRTLACMGNFRVIADAGILTLESLND